MDIHRIEWGVAFPVVLAGLVQQDRYRHFDVDSCVCFECKQAQRHVWAWTQSLAPEATAMRPRNFWQFEADTVSLAGHVR